MTIHCNKNITKQPNSYAIEISITLQCLLQSIKHALKDEFIYIYIYIERERERERESNLKLNSRVTLVLGLKCPNKYNFKIQIYNGIKLANTIPLNNINTINYPKRKY